MGRLVLFERPRLTRNYSIQLWNNLSSHYRSFCYQEKLPIFPVHPDPFNSTPSVFLTVIAWWLYAVQRGDHLGRDFTTGSACLLWGKKVSILVFGICRFGDNCIFYKRFFACLYRVEHLRKLH